MRLIESLYRAASLAIGRARGIRYRLSHGFIIQSAPQLRVNGVIRFLGYHGLVTIGRGARLNGPVYFVLNDPDSRGIVRAGSGLCAEHGCTLAPRGGEILLGADCFLGPGVHLQAVAGARIEIGSHLMVAKGACLYACQHHTQSLSLPMKAQGESGKGIQIADDVWIGANAVILDGVALGRGCIVAAGAVVTRSVPAHAVVAGVPARILRLRTNQVERTNPTIPSAEEG